MIVVNIPSESAYTDLYSLSGIEPSTSLIITSNSPYPCHLIQTQFQPADNLKGVPLYTGDTTLVHANVDPIWIRGGAGPIVVQKLTETIVPFISVDLPQDIYTNRIEGLRRPKISSEPSIAAAILNGFAYTISGSFSVAGSGSLAMNLSPASDIIVHKIVTNLDHTIEVYNELATGTADGIFDAENMNLLSVDESPAQGQLYSPATTAGSVIASGISILEPYIICGLNNKAAIVVNNNSAMAASIKITVIFEEIGPRASSFGLTASTEIFSDTEMSIYG